MVMTPDQRSHAIRARVDAVQVQVAGIVSINIDNRLSALEATIVGNISCMTVVTSGGIISSGTITASGGSAVVCGSLNVITGPGSGDISCRVVNAAGAVIGGTTNVSDLNVTGNVVSNLYLTTGNLTVANGGSATVGSLAVIKTPGSGVVSCYDMNASHVITAAGAVISGTTNVTDLNVSGNVVSNLYLSTGNLTVANGGAIACGSISVVKTPGSGVVGCYDMNASHVITAAGAIIGGTTNVAAISASGNITAAGGLTASGGSSIFAGFIRSQAGPGSGDMMCDGTLTCSSYSTNPAWTAPAALSTGGSTANSLICATINVLIDRLGPSKLHLLN